MTGQTCQTCAHWDKIAEAGYPGVSVRLGKDRVPMVRGVPDAVVWMAWDVTGFHPSCWSCWSDWSQGGKVGESDHS